MGVEWAIYYIMNIAIDVDGVVADLVPKLLNDINHKFKTEYRIEDCTMWNFYDRENGMFHDPEHADYALKLMQSNHYAANLLPIKNAVHMVNALSEAGHNIIWVTAPFRSSKTWSFDRTNWILEHFPACSKHIILTDRKEWIDADILIDDNPENVVNWTSRGAVHKEAYLYAQPWNREFRKTFSKKLTINDWYDQKIKNIIDYK